MKWQTLTVVARQLLSLAVFAALARLLDPAAFGLVGLVGVYLSFIMIFADQGISTALIQRKELTNEHLDTAFWFNLACSAALALGTIAFAGRIAAFFGQPELVPLLRWSSLALVINAASAIHATLFVRDMDFRQPAIRALLANVVGGIVGIAMALLGFGVWSLVGQQLASASAGAVFLWSVSPYRPSFRFSPEKFRDLFNISFSVFLTAILWFLSTRLDQVVVGRFAGAVALGLYVIAAKGPDLAQLLTHQPMADVALPALARLQDNNAKMCKAIYDGMRLNALVSFALFIGLAAVAPNLIAALFGNRWAGAAAYCSLLCICSLINVLQVFFHPALLASGGIGKYVLLNVCHVCGVLAACLIGIRFGVSQLIVGLIINGVVMTVPNVLFLKHRIGLSVVSFLRPCLVPAFAAALMALAVWWTPSLLSSSLAPGFRLLVQVPVGAAVYLGCIAILAPQAIRSLLNMAAHAFPAASLAPSPTT
ncbi:MAG TPA: lipopolysaccharide biosynthesis protein [Opitutaceae bacterium]|jgi:PST family polysaccharide transporter